MYPFPTPERIQRGTGLQEFYAESRFAEILVKVEACLQHKAPFALLVDRREAVGHGPPEKYFLNYKN
jgi:hypothetical protein